MKDSGIPWLGQIPEQWGIEKVKRMFKLRTSKGNITPTLLAATQKHGMYPQSKLDSVVQVAENTDLQNFRTVHVNDYVISLRSFQGGFEISEYEGVCSPAYQVFYSTGIIHHKYYKTLFKSLSFIDHINSLTVGIREGKNIQYETFSYSFLPVPPLLEQERIAEYLDGKCAEIDELISVEERMIAELQAYKQSIITETVTRGLNPDNDLPQGWISTTISKLCYTINGLWTGEKGTLLNVGVIRNANFTKDFKLDYSKIEYIDVEEDSFRKRNLLYGDLIVEKSGGSDKAPVGRTVIYEGVDGQYSFSNFTMVLRTKDKNLIASKYLYYYLLMLYIQGYMNLVQVHTTGLHNLIIGKFLSIKIPVPPLPEQQTIAEDLDRKCEEIDALVEVKQRKIEKLKEYKKSVIYEYVTGKREIS